jgi:hypothetical protein
MQYHICSKHAGTRVPPTVRNMPVKIWYMVIFLHHDLYNLALKSTCTYSFESNEWKALANTVTGGTDRDTKYFWKFNHVTGNNLIKEIKTVWNSISYCYIKALTKLIYVLCIEYQKHWSWTTCNFLKNKKIDQNPLHMHIFNINTLYQYSVEQEGLHLKIVGVD